VRAGNIPSASLGEKKRLRWNEVVRYRNEGREMLHKAEKCFIIIRSERQWKIEEALYRAGFGK
jgi:hypothetical protein